MSPKGISILTGMEFLIERNKSWWDFRFNKHIGLILIWGGVDMGLKKFFPAQIQTPQSLLKHETKPITCWFTE